MPGSYLVSERTGMDILGKVDVKIAASIEEAEAANKVSGMKRALDRTWEFFVGKPDYLPEEPQATVTGIAEARDRRQPQPVTETLQKDIAHPITAAPTHTEGNVVDMTQRRRVETARANVVASYPSVPEPSQIEDLFQA
jgi:hypothetical protein